MLSVVVPTLDEEARIGTLVSMLLAEVEEVVVSDGGSRDRTRAVAEAAGARVVEGPRGRGPQLDRGASAARGDLLWFLHADAAVPAGLATAVKRAAEAAPWGACETRIGSADPRLRWTAFVMTRRARWTGAMTGDMCIWARRTLFERVGGFGTLPALEDLDFTDRARAVAPWTLVSPPLGTSARRWTARGINQTMARMLAIRLAYRLGASPLRLARMYQSAPR